MNPAALEQAILDEAVMLLVGIRVEVCEGSLAAGLAKVVANLVLQNTHEPALLCASPGELTAAFERGQKRFLHHVLGFGGIAQADERILEKIIAMFFDPSFRVGQANRGSVLLHQRHLVWSGKIIGVHGV